MPSSTPYFRVTPVEGSLPGKNRNIPLNIQISDPREVLPIDIITEMVRREPLIGVSECYCRLARENRGDGSCEHIRETCFTFNELAQTLIETGLAREVDHEEAAGILARAEEDGLIHNVDNCQGELKALCNCCPCCCPAVRSFQRGVRNVNAPSRYHAVFVQEACKDCGACVEVCPVGAIHPQQSFPEIRVEECIGCGHCVNHCPEGAIHISLRADQERIPRTNDQLWGTIRREAIISMVKDKILPW
jgi:NAD-dependent dihydropyrimidine dehydrogenase PreA subunit